MPKAKKPRKPKLAPQFTAPTYKAAAKELRKVDAGILHHVLLSSGDPRFITLAHELNAPKYSQTNKWTLTELCGMHKIRLADVAKLFKDEMLAVAQIEQMKHAPDILETNAVAAIGRKVPCPTCLAEGYSGEPCMTCGDTKWVQNAGDPNALKVFAESAGLSGRGSPLVNFNLNQFNGAGSFEDLMARAEKPRQIVEVKAE